MVCYTHPGDDSPLVHAAASTVNEGHACCMMKLLMNVILPSQQLYK